MSVSEAMRRAKYAPSSVKQSHRIPRAEGIKGLLDMVFDPVYVANKHRQLLNASRIEHMVFPLAMTDDEIVELLAQNNCTVKKFMHSETQTHVWYFMADNMAQDKALDKVYKLRGDYAPEEVDVKSAGLSLVSLFEKAEQRRKTKK